ncbi:MAG: aspartate aminotransferase family protein [Alphaproteobacteria bacterium]|nr:aspartate aminotransferase family protein [Alphaproteobacteria bacterium]
MANANTSRVLHREVRKVPPLAAKGDGVYFVDQAGRRYLDACGGAAVSCLGHSDRTVIDAIKRQLDAFAFAHTGYFTADVLETLATRLTGIVPGAFARASFYCGGSEGMEAALKNARQYFVEKGETSRSKFIARRQSFHGNTLGTLSIGNHAVRSAPYLPYMFSVAHIAPCYLYRDKRDGETEAQYACRVADELETEILREGPENIAAFVAETVTGATLGAAPGAAGYFKRIREICDKYGVLLILDEVMSGSGRTGTWFAFEQEGIAPDIAVIAKGLGAGYQPIASVLLAPKIVEAMEDGSGAVAHSHTYMGHACGAAAALAVLDVVEKQGLLANVQKRGRQLRGIFDEHFANHPHVGDIRGRGLLMALELVEDRATKKPFERGGAIAAGVKAAALDLGLMVYPSSGTIDGKRGAHVLLAPPYVIDESHVAEIAEKLPVAIDRAIERHAKA